MKKTDDKKDIIKLKDIFEMYKISDQYQNSTKQEKRDFNYKNFCFKLESNIFFRTLIKKNKDKIKILINYKINEDIL